MRLRFGNAHLAIFESSVRAVKAAVQLESMSISLRPTMDVTTAATLDCDLELIIK